MAHTHPTEVLPENKLESCPFEATEPNPIVLMPTPKPSRRKKPSVAGDHWRRKRGGGPPKPRPDFKLIRNNVPGDLGEFSYYIRQYFYKGFMPHDLAHIYNVPTVTMRAFVNGRLGLEFDSDWGKELPGVELMVPAGNQGLSS